MFLLDSILVEPFLEHGAEIIIDERDKLRERDVNYVFLVIGDIFPHVCLYRNGFVYDKYPWKKEAHKTPLKEYMKMQNITYKNMFVCMKMRRGTYAGEHQPDTNVVGEDVSCLRFVCQQLQITSDGQIHSDMQIVPCAKNLFMMFGIPLDF